VAGGRGSVDLPVAYEGNSAARLGWGSLSFSLGLRPTVLLGVRPDPAVKGTN
jgi:hypothetical protein